jgi:hypothetical protein
LNNLWLFVCRWCRYNQVDIIRNDFGCVGVAPVLALLEPLTERDEPFVMLLLLLLLLLANVPMRAFSTHLARALVTARIFAFVAATKLLLAGSLAWSLIAGASTREQKRKRTKQR